MQNPFVRLSLGLVVLGGSVLLRAAERPEPAGLTVTPSGLRYVITHHGEGARPKPGQVVIVHYTGTLPDGTVFDSSREKDEPFAFTLGREQVIKGWDEALALLHVGDRATLVIPPDLAYGNKVREKIPANSTLRFDIELLELKNGALADRLQETLDQKGLAAAGAFFADYQAGKLGELYLSEGQLNGLGYRYLGKGQLPEALAVLGWNVQLFPQSGNVYDSYGEALLKNGQPEAAKANYEKSLALDPANKNAEKVLADLRAAEASPAAKAQLEARLALEAALDQAYLESEKEVYDVPALKAKLTDFLVRYPSDPAISGLVGNYLYYVESAGLDLARAEWAGLALSPIAAVRERAEEKLQLGELLKTPLELSFTAADGRAVDLAALRGKVVLVDFWATWCPPCLEEIPNVVAVYNEYHDRGFEIVGITFDQAPDPAMPAKRQKTAEQVLAFTREHGMPWPQYYDGTYWKNPYGKKFGVRGIPAMFLVGRDGLVVSTNARGPKLAAEVKRLLQP